MGTREGLNDRFTARGVPRASDYDYEDSREIERDIQRTRGAMDATIDELVARLQPREIARGVWSYLLSPSQGGGGGRSTGARVSESASWLGSAVGHGVARGVRVGGESVAEGVYEGACRGSSMLLRFARQNPIPSAMMGAGLTYYVVDRFVLADGGQGEYEREREWQAAGPAVYGAEMACAEVPESDYAVSGPQAGIVLPPGADIDSPDYPLEGTTGGPAAGGQQSRTSQMAGKMASSASAGASAASQATGNAASRVRSATESAAHAAADAGRSSWDSTSRTARGAASAAGEAASSARHAAADAGRYSREAAYGAAHGTRESLSHAASATYRGASTASEATVDGMRNAGQAIRSGAMQTREAAKDATEQYPLLVGLGCAAAGLMAGFLLPRTRREDEMMGESAQEMRDRGYEMGRDAVEQGQEMASATATAAMERAEEEGLTPSQLADRVGNVARKAVDSTKEAAREEGLTGDELAREASAVKEEAKETAKKETPKPK